jgi:large conductance mechanosensitive channel
MWNEFRKFIARGSVVELAVGIVIGAAFASVVNSFVNDVLMPPVGLVTGGVNFTELYIPLSDDVYATRAEAMAAGAPIISYGLFISSIIAFLIVAMAVFMLVKSYNRISEPKEATPVTPTERECPQCLFKVPVKATRCAHCTSVIAAA